MSKDKIIEKITKTRSYQSGYHEKEEMSQDEMNKTCYIVSCTHNQITDVFTRKYRCEFDDRKYCHCISDLFEIPFKEVLRLKNNV